MTVNIVDILNIHLWMLALVELQIWVYLRKFTLINILVNTVDVISEKRIHSTNHSLGIDQVVFNGCSTGG